MDRQAPPNPASTGSASARHPWPRSGVWIGGAAILLGGMLLLWRFALPAHSTELVDLWKISEGEALGAVVYLISIGLMCAGWLWAIESARSRSLREVWLPLAILTILVYGTFLLVYPATAIDVYIYAARSHLLTDSGLNPSTVTPDRFWELDPYLRYASPEWADDTSPYGPLWNILAAPATALDGNQIGTAILIFKGIMLTAALGVGALVYSIARVVQPGLAVSAAIAWLWCPVVLWEGIANSHNDVALMLLVVAAFWCWTYRHEGGVIPFLGAAALLKVVAVIIIPAAIVAIVVRVGWNRRLLVVALQTFALSTGALWIAFAPFYDIGGTIDAIQSQRGVWVTSPAALLDSLVRDYELDIDYREYYRRFSTAVIVLLAAGGALVAWRRPALLPRIAYEQLFWFLLLATSNLRPWYAIWLAALAVLLPMGWPFVRSAALTVGALAAYIYSAWFQNWTDPTWTERTGINVAIMLFPVLIMTVWEASRAIRTRWAARATGIPTPPSDNVARLS